MTELLIPAGSPEKLKYALAYGADAVYLGLPFFSLRARENPFDYESVQECIEFAHAQNRRVYVTANIFARNRKLSAFEESLDQWKSLKPDAMIMSDPGLIMEVRKKLPDIPIHLSVQANCMNWKAVQFWHEVVGVERIILSRELNLNEIREIKDRVPDVELEAFVHGSICIAFSGRCLLSSYFSYRDANQGVCDNSCREKFQLYGQPRETQEFFLEDMRDPGPLYKIDEDENGTYIMNAKDLRLIMHLKEIRDSGIESFKVEGRTKSLYYVALVTRAYRKAIDDLDQGCKFDPSLLDELDKIANRGYHTGFMMGSPGKDSNLYDTSLSRNFTQNFAGAFKDDCATPLEGFYPIDVRGQIRKGMKAEIIGPHLFSKTITISEIVNSRGQKTEIAHSGSGTFFIQLDEPPPPYSVLSSIPRSSESKTQTRDGAKIALQT